MEYEWIFLNGLADDIGLEAGLVRQAVLTIASEAVINATTEQNLVLKQGATEDFGCIAAYGGSGAHPSTTVKPGFEACGWHLEASIRMHLDLTL